MKRFIFYLLCPLISLPSLHAQQLQPDGSVLFTYHKPDAQKAELVIDGTTYPMKMNAQRIWEVRVSNLVSNLYTFLYYIDGVPALDQQSPHRMRDVASTFNYFIIPNGKGEFFNAQKVPHGTIQQVWYPNIDNTQQRRMTIYLPPSYNTDDKYYPVLYLLHGSGGDELAWLELGRVAEILDNMIENGKCKEMIVVLPNGNTYQDASPAYFSEPTQWADNKVRLSGTFEETFPDILSFVERNYRTITKKHARAIAGLSMGGYHAMHISHYLSQMFDYVGLFSATYNPTVLDEEELLTATLTFTLPQNKQTPRVYRNIEKDLQRQFATPPTLYWIAIGKDDFLYQENVQYRAFLDKNHYPYIYHESAGGHTWANWREYLLLFLPQLF